MSPWPGLIDTHCHIDDPVFDSDRSQLLQACRAQGVCALVVPAIHQAQWETQAAVIASDAMLYGAYGLHPCYMEYHTPAHVALLEQTLVQQRACAVGEIGLDFFIAGHDPAAQLALFEAQVAVARNLDLPVILHARRCHDVMLKVLRKAGLRGGVAHAFSGSLQQARVFAELGFLIGFGGGVTYDRANKLHGILNALPLESIVLETDAPDIPPCFARDVPNSPLHLPEIAHRIAERRGVSTQALAETTTGNARRVFQLAV